MNIALLRLANVRCFEALDFAPTPGINWLVGSNGAGKTTLLEAAYILSHGRSFRAGGRSAPCRHGAAEFTMHAELESRVHGRKHKLGLTRREDRWLGRMDGSDLVSLAPLFEACPVVYFGPESVSLILGAAEERRNFLDWSVFHVEHASLEIWRKWRRGLRQRNTLLRVNAADTLFEPWEHELAALAEQINRLRSECLASLDAFLMEESRLLVPELGHPAIVYRPGWDEEIGLGAELAEHRKRDRERGFTQRGPHRADWSLRYSRVSQREHLSRGQAKAVALVCALALVRWLRERIGEYPLLCLDDLGSELDSMHAAKVTTWLRDKPLQSWLTATSMPARCPEDASVFHVEHTGVRAA